MKGPPASVAGLKFRSNTSTAPVRKLAPNRKFPSLLPTSARPLYTAFAPELSTTVFASPVPFHPARMPSSVSNRNESFVKSVLVLATVPVGQPGLHGEFAAEGIPTTSVCLLPCASYRVEVPPLLFAIQNGLPGMKEIPHGFES